MITQLWLEKQVRRAGIPLLRSLMGRQRLKFTLPEIAFYLHQILLHMRDAKRFRKLHANALKAGTTSLSYSGYMKNIQSCSVLAGYLHIAVIAQGNVTTDGLTLIDTSLLPQKRNHCITGKDWDRHRVTTRRSKQGEKVRTCGLKGLFVCNGKSQILFAQLMPINTSDQNTLKDSAWLSRYLEDCLVLADRGFNNKKVRERLASLRNCKFVSPPRKTGEWLSSDDCETYKQRWAIETLFQQMKDEFGSFKLNLAGVISTSMVRAKFFLAITSYNLSKI